MRGGYLKKRWDILTDSKVRIEANIEAAKASGFHLNSQLLQLARIIKPDGGKE